MRIKTLSDIEHLARLTMAEYGFLSRFSSGALKEAKALHPEALRDEGVQDLRYLLWSSIDNEDSQDLDQVAYCQQLPKDEIRIQVAIADVDHYVRPRSAIDQFAFKNATSVYTGIMSFPMLPPRLSHDITSLNPAEDRLAIVTDFVVDPKGNVHSGDVYRALIHNHAKLVYEPVGEWLEGLSDVPGPVAALPGLEAQLLLQHKAAQRLQAFRRERGAQDFDSVEVVPVVEHGRLAGLKERRDNLAHHLIENFMIAANGVMAVFLKRHQIPVIQRVVRTPERWDRIRDLAMTHGDKLPQLPDPRALADFLERRKEISPEQFPDISLSVIKLLGKAEYTVTYPHKKGEGHFGLAVEDYAHSTAPNRRYVDLIGQRLVKCALSRSPVPYQRKELESIARWCTDRDQAAKKVERFMVKVAAAVILEPRVGETFNAIVTGATEKGIFVRLEDPPAEGKVICGFQKMDVGDKVRVRLISLKPAKGFIDFEGVGPQVKKEAPPLEAPLLTPKRMERLMEAVRRQSGGRSRRRHSRGGGRSSHGRGQAGKK